MPAILEMKQITKVFLGVMVLNNVSYAFEKGEVNVLLGKKTARKNPY